VNDLLTSHKKLDSAALPTRHQSQATVERKDSIVSHSHQRSGSRGPMMIGQYQKKDSFAQMERKGSLASISQISHRRTESRGMPTGRHPSHAQLERKDSVIIKNTIEGGDYGKFNGMFERSSSKNLIRSNSTVMGPMGAVKSSTMKYGGQVRTNMQKNQQQQSSSNIKVIHVDIGKRVPGEKDASMRKTSMSAINESYLKTGERQSYSKIHGGDRHSANQLSVTTNIKPRQYFNYKFTQPITPTTSQQNMRLSHVQRDLNAKKKY